MDQPSHAAATKDKCGTQNRHLACVNMPNSISGIEDAASLTPPLCLLTALRSLTPCGQRLCVCLFLFQWDLINVLQRRQESRNIKMIKDLFSALINLINRTLNCSQINFNCLCRTYVWRVCVGRGEVKEGY